MNGPAELEPPGTRTTRRRLMATPESSAPPAHPFTGKPPRHGRDERPHACNDGWVTIGQIAIDPETGEETEEYALYLCRRCAERTRSEARA